MTRLIPGILALFGCIALALLNVSAYVRHLDSGDQAGFSMGTSFLVGWFLPIAATLLLIGGILIAPVGARRGSRPLRIVAVTILALSVTALVCALTSRRDSSSPRKGGARWLSGLMVILAAIVSYQIAAQVAGFISDGMLPVYLPLVAGPTLVWAGVLVWSAWQLSRKGAAAKGEGTREEAV